MSTVMVVTPLVIAHWPAIAAAVSAAAGALGFAAATEMMREFDTEPTRTEIEVENTDILEAGGTGESLVLERDGVRAEFTRDARGALRLCLEGQGLTKLQLKQLGEELIGRVTQQYVYHRVVSELAQRNMPIVQEEVLADQTVRIRVRNW